MTRQILQYHPTIGHIYVPSIKARVEHESGGYLVRTNATGFRADREFEPRKRAGLSRVLLFGDSMVAGDGVSNGRRFGDRLEELLPGIEVYNYGLPGTGQDQQYLAFREFAGGIERDLVVIAVWLENIARVAAPYKRWGVLGSQPQIFAKPYFELAPDGSLDGPRHVPVPKRAFAVGELPRGARVHESVRQPPDGYAADVREPVPMPASVSRRRGRLEAAARRGISLLGPRAVDAARRLRNGPLLPEYRRTDHPDWRLMRALLQRWIAEAEAPVVIFPIPMAQHVEGPESPSDYQARFAELHDPPTVWVHDPYRDLRRRSAAERRSLRFEFDFHPTPAGHLALAESLAATIREAMPVAVG